MFNRGLTIGLWFDKVQCVKLIDGQGRKVAGLVQPY
jgi:hypothetical protein